MAKVETERFFGKKGIIIMIRDGSKLVSAIFKDKKNADKFNRNKPADVKKLLQLAKKTKFPKGIDEDTDVGHQDDEPNMLKSTTLEIMEYGKKLTDMLDKYDDMDGEVDFPNWWQKKLILARDYVSAAYHYLDSEEKTSENMDRNFRSYDDEEEVEEGFASNAQRKAAFASGYKAKGKKGKKKNESINEDSRTDAVLRALNKIIPKLDKELKAAYRPLVSVSSSIEILINAISYDKRKDFKNTPKKQVELYKKGDDFVKDLAAARKVLKDISMLDLRKSLKESIGESVNEGKKRFKRQDGIGKAKYTVSYHDGKKKHKDGSDFFDIKIFKNKKDLSDFVGTLAKQGYKLTRESVNENRGFVTKMLNKKLTIKRIGSRERFKDTKSGKVFKKDGFAFHIPGKGYIGYRDEKGMPYTPGGGKKALQQILDDGGFLDYKKLVLINPVNESVNEASREAMGIAGFTGTRGSAVQKFIDDYNLNARKLFNFVKKGKLKDRMDFVTAIAGKPGNKFQGKMVGMFGESINECWDTHKQVGMKMKGGKQVPNCVPKNEIKEDKNQIVQLKKKVGKSEIKFYDALSKIEKKLGKKNYRAFLEKGLKDFKLNPKHYDYRSNGAAEEKLFNLAK